MITDSWLNAFEQCLDESEHKGCASHDGETCDCGVYDTRQLVAAYREMALESARLRALTIYDEGMVVTQGAFHALKDQRDAAWAKLDRLTAELDAQEATAIILAKLATLREEQRDAARAEVEAAFRAGYASGDCAMSFCASSMGHAAIAWADYQRDREVKR